MEEVLKNKSNKKVGRDLWAHSVCRGKHVERRHDGYTETLQKRKI